MDEEEAITNPQNFQQIADIIQNYSFIQQTTEPDQLDSTQAIYQTIQALIKRDPPQYTFINPEDTTTIAWQFANDLVHHYNKETNRWENSVLFQWAMLADVLNSRNLHYTKKTLFVSHLIRGLDLDTLYQQYLKIMPKASDHLSLEKFKEKSKIKTNTTQDKAKQRKEQRAKVFMGKAAHNKKISKKTYCCLF